MKTNGHIVVTSDGTVVLLTTLDRQAEPDNLGRIVIYDIGTTLRSRTHPIGARWAGSEDSYRVVAHVDDALRLLEAAGVDLSALEPESEVERLRRRVAELERQVESGIPTSAVDTLQQ